MNTCGFTADGAVDGTSALRAATARSLGGPYLDALQIDSAYRAASTWLLDGTEGRARGSTTVPTEISGTCDGGIAVLGMALELIRTRDPHLAIDTSELIFLGCRTVLSPALRRSLMRALDRGAVVIASDRSAELSPLGGLLLNEEPSGPRRARVAMSIESLSLQPLPVYPAIRLPAGHMPLTRSASRVDGSTVLARDVLTGNSLAVLVPMLSGSIVYSSAHWLQDEPVDLSAAGQRALFSAPAYASIGRQYPSVTVGEFHAAAASLNMLATGLWLALHSLQTNAEHGESGLLEVNSEGCNGASAA